MSLKVNGTDITTVYVEKVDKQTKEVTNRIRLTSMLCNGIEVLGRDRLWLAFTQTHSNLVFGSIDGHQWQSFETGAGTVLDGSAVYADGIWINVGTYKLRWSIDDVHWTEAYSVSGISGAQIYEARHMSGIWVACTSKAGILWSNDGKTWTKGNIQTEENLSIYTVRSNGAIWVASTNNGLYWSQDGKTWTKSNITTGDFGGGARCSFGSGSGAGVWVACSTSDNGLYSSQDGKTWTKSNITTGDFIGGARYANNIWVACASSGDGRLYWSYDGETWTVGLSGSSLWFAEARYGGGKWLAFPDTSGAQVYQSTDGKNWTAISQSTTNLSFHKGVHYAEDREGVGIWIAGTATVTPNTMVSSLDGEYWDQDRVTLADCRQPIYSRTLTEEELMNIMD